MNGVERILKDVPPMTSNRAACSAVAPRGIVYERSCFKPAQQANSGRLSFLDSEFSSSRNPANPAAHDVVTSTSLAKNWVQHHVAMNTGAMQCKYHVCSNNIVKVLL